MSEKKELNIEELEKVSGGKGYTSNESELTWDFELNLEVLLYKPGSGNFTGVIKKHGKLYLYGVFLALYYIEFASNPELNGWYNDDAVRKNNMHYNSIHEDYYSSIVIVD